MYIEIQTRIFEGKYLRKEQEASRSKRYRHVAFDFIYDFDADKYVVYITKHDLLTKFQSIEIITLARVQVVKQTFKSASLTIPRVVGDENCADKVVAT